MSENANRPVWHTLDLDEVLKRVDSSSDGLSTDQARKRLDEHGPNALGADESVSKLRLLLRQVKSPLIYLLAAAVIISLIAGKMIDAGAILVVIILNTILGFVQEWRAEGALAALREMSAPDARVYRDGDVQTIDATEVVPGDVLVLETGDRVAADARVLDSDDLESNESALTGEAEPVGKESGQVEEDAPTGDRRNMVWMSTSVTGGRGRAVVVETGMQTEMGRIAGDVRSTGREETPLQKRMHRLGLLLGVLGLIMASLVLGLGLMRGYETVEMLLFSVAVAVSAIPAGLPAVVTVTLALGVRRMASRNAIIRRLPAVETLGSTTVICSDKTGTITANQMTVRRIWAGGNVYDVTGEGYDPEGEIRAESGEEVQDLPESLQQLLRIGALANNADIEQQDDKWTAEGNPSEAALLVAARKGGLDPNRLRKEIERVDEVPFSSDRKYMAVLVPTEDGDGRTALIKGGADKVLAFCSHALIEDERVELDDERRREIHEHSEEFASQALRVMAGAYRGFASGKQQLAEQDVEEGLTFVGMWGMIDPPREQSRKAVESAKEAGIRPVLITGDFAATAEAIARQVGIAGEGGALGARDVEQKGKRELAEATLSSGVFARVSPEHKLRIMEALKDQGHVVAMTGDGVNDAPALKGADIGIAMGGAGTEVAKEAADMVLTDDNFATIISAIEEGRTIFANLRGAVFFLLATSLGEVLTLSAALLLGLDLPLTAVMVLWVNLITDGACTIPLGVEPRHWDVLKQPPRDPDEPIINKVMIRRMALLTPIMAAGTLGLFYYQQQSGDLQHARTVAFTTLAAFQWFQAFNARSQFQSAFSIGFLGNRWLLLGVSIAVGLQVLVVQTPIGGWVFGTKPLGLTEWLWIVLVSSTIWIADEILKRLGVHGRRPS